MILSSSGLSLCGACDEIATPLFVPPPFTTSFPDPPSAPPPSSLQSLRRMFGEDDSGLTGTCYLLHPGVERMGVLSFAVSLDRSLKPEEFAVGFVNGATFNPAMHALGGPARACVSMSAVVCGGLRLSRLRASFLSCRRMCGLLCVSHPPFPL